jgi:hypothetical protein
MRMMLFSLILLLCCANDVYAATKNQKKLSFEVHQKNYTFSTCFEMNSGDQPLGSIVKSCFSIRTNYILYDHLGNYEGDGVCRLFTLGAFRSWGTEIDVYDKNDVKIGLIDGQVATSAAAKFSIYNAEGNRVGIAYLDLSKSGFTIVDPENENHLLVSYKRNFVQDTIDHWDVVVYEKDVIDIRIIKVFAGFCVDTQKNFKKDS